LTYLNASVTAIWIGCRQGLGSWSIWAEKGGVEVSEYPLHAFLKEHAKKQYNAYKSYPEYLKEQHGIEQTVLAGGYAYRQILELVQNGADAIIEAYEAGDSAREKERIRVVLTDEALLVGNTGASLSKDGLQALLSSHSSTKRGYQIGRFGLGFKSLLSLGSYVDIFTRKSGAIRFDPERCRQELREAFGVTDAPGLRLAYPLEEALSGEEWDWAETVVRVEVPNELNWRHLLDEIENFPTEFLLFFPVPVTLELDAAIAPEEGGDEEAQEEIAPRVLRVDTDGEERLLHNGEKETRWRVITKEVHITDEAALQDATAVHGRGKVPMSWAFPLNARTLPSGRFWAFFPTDTHAFMPGILNAPWKLNSDRNAIITGDWNKALMAEAAQIIVETLPTLSKDDDPARPLDFFPRQMDSQNEVAAHLVESVWDGIEAAKIIPDANNNLRMGRDLSNHPLENMEIAEQWTGCVSEESLLQFVHPKCFRTAGRRARLDALASRLSEQFNEKANHWVLKTATPDYWFQCAADTDFERTKASFELAEAYSAAVPSYEWKRIRKELRLIPDATGKLCTPDEVMFAPAGTEVPGRSLVASAITEDPECRRILEEVFEVQELDQSVWLKALQELLPSQSPLNEWDQKGEPLWHAINSAPSEVQEKFIRERRHRLKVCRADGNWASPSDTLLPGRLVEAGDDSKNRIWLVDTVLHKLQSLQLLGVEDFPEGIVKLSDHEFLDEWISHWHRYYHSKVNQRARWEYLNPKDADMPGGWKFIGRLTGVPLATLSKHFLKLLAGEKFPERVKFGHSTPSYPEIDVSHPLPWLLGKCGNILIGDRIVSVRALVSERLNSSLHRLDDWNFLKLSLEAIARTEPNVFEKVDAEDLQSEIDELWEGMLEVFLTSEAMENDSLRELCAQSTIVPDELPTRSGLMPIEEIFVTTSTDLATRARYAGHSVVTLDDETLTRWIEHGAKDLQELMSPDWDEALGFEDLLVSCVPDIEPVLTDEHKESGRCLPVRGLRLIVDRHTQPIACLMWQHKLYLDIEQLNALSHVDQMESLLAELSGAGWLSKSLEDARERLADQQVQQLRAKVASGETLLTRLCLAVGGRIEPLIEALPEMEFTDFLANLDIQVLAGLVLTQLGPNALQALKDAMNEEGLNPPRRWGTAEARSFVVSIGFPEEYAASASTKREPEEQVSGPIELPALHDFQEEVFEGIDKLINTGNGRRRAVISLPTGGGKTRVCVEAAVKLVLAPPGDCRCVLWIAQTDELCEQAVQAFRQVWVNLGARGTDLRIIRMWGNNENPTVQSLDRPVTVIATIQTLSRRLGLESLSWLKKPGLLVIDECHHGVTISYSKLFNWLDVGLAKSKEGSEEPPVLGLSATPFRTDDDESSRLAKRFDQRWFPEDQEQLHSRLLERGVLARTRFEALESGVELTEAELSKLDDLEQQMESLNFDHLLLEINQRLAGVPDRNQRIVDRIKAGQEESILFFANSVKHANEIAVRLNLDGVSAATISDDTSPVSRRHLLAKFQDGAIRVICNFNVLSTGFDAPKIDMVFIARQVFSPVRYMQMVGRGLRGEKNGGTESCQILTVMDNLGRFQVRHPYHYCEKYFSNWGRP